MTKTPRYQLHAWLIVLVLLNQLAASLPAAADTSERFVGTVLFMRHALAPGFGDPDHFSIKDCSSQRNLDETGRAQAQAIGAKLAAADIKFSAIYSSHWCRCLETAQLLNLGAVTPFEGLNSFYQNHASRDATLAKLRLKLDSLSPSTPASLMVTHSVTIRAITGLSVASGGVVIFDLKTGSARELSLSSL
jgi:broad specificity phosphatase PhoE